MITVFQLSRGPDLCNILSEVISWTLDSSNMYMQGVLPCFQQEIYRRRVRCFPMCFGHQVGSAYSGALPISICCIELKQQNKHMPREERAVLGWKQNSVFPIAPKNTPAGAVCLSKGVVLWTIADPLPIIPKHLFVRVFFLKEMMVKLQVLLLTSCLVLRKLCSLSKPQSLHLWNGIAPVVPWTQLSWAFKCWLFTFLPNREVKNGWVDIFISWKE